MAIKISRSLLVIIISILMVAHNVKSASFNFPSFGPYTNYITFQGDAFASNGVVQLTKLGQGNNVPLPNSVGRASYTGPVHLWDVKSGQLAGFTTTFSFVVAPSSPGLFGDGISFFIAPFNSYIPQNSSGGFLGLFSADSAFNAYENQVVAVEFDSYGNSWDPVSSHIGIDINSIVSAKTVPWVNGNLVSPVTAFATVTYEPITKNLSAIVTYPQSQVYQNVSSSSLSFVIDLRTVLPEWVRIGFSGATGQLVEVHKILSWSFNSSLI
ncbi:hypothetical protein VNO77_40198 [Canavalia gladiata]|uniref:Legume lectin domain-containing protein n=1 Tax=Canavalia gladiata TaxID=3824 RepID=A0AAN9PPG6_CANGL